MNREPNETVDPRDPDELRTLASALDDLQPHPPAVPGSVDAAILSRARLALGRPRRRPVRLFRWAGVAAAAAAALLLSLFSDWPRPARDPMDIDRSGRVDILDAFAMARRIETGPSPDAAWDLNRDGRIDRKDVDVVAMAAVKISREAYP
jgi:hypothetical protein